MGIKLDTLSDRQEKFPDEFKKLAEDFSKRIHYYFFRKLN